MFVGIRLPDETVAAIDEAASAIGTTRSGWIAHAVSKQLPDVGTGKAPGRPRRQKGEARVHFRMSAEELAQVERAAKRIGLTRTEFFIASARGRVWRDQDVIKHSPDTKEEMRDGIRQLNAIGRNLNQAVKALHEAKAERSESSLARSMEDLIEACSVLDAGVEDALHRLFGHIAVEQDAWRWRD
jgi:uncharacterized protein (DUF1778 family)